MSKTSKQRPGTGYADNWEATFGKKAKSEQALQELTDLSQELGLYDQKEGPRWVLNPNALPVSSDGQRYIATANADGSVSVEPADAKPVGEPVSYKLEDLFSQSWSKADEIARKI